MAKVPCEFRTNRPTFIFQGRLRQAGEQPSPAEDGASSAAVGSGRDLAHLLRAALLPGVGGMDLPSSGDASLIIPQVPSEFRANRPTFVFQGKMSRGSAAPRGLGVWACRLQGVMSYPWPRSPVSFEWIGQPSFFSRYPVTAA